MRCHAQEVDAESLPAGMRYEDNTLIVPDVSRLVIFAVNSQSIGALTELEALEDGELQVVLGGFTPSDDSTTLEAIAARGPALLLPGGEDNLEALDDALDESFEGRENLVDLRGVYRVTLGRHTFVTMPGAENGRYAAPGACGFGEADVDTLSDVFESGDHLLTWATPRREGADPLDQGVLGAHSGSALLAAFKIENDVQGGVSAWPREGAAERSGGDAVEAVAPILGGVTVTRRGARAVLPPVVLDVSGDVITRE